MVRIKVIRLSQCIKYAIIALCAIALLLMLAWLWPGGNTRAAGGQYTQAARLNGPSDTAPAAPAFAGGRVLVASAAGWPGVVATAEPDADEPEAIIDITLPAIEPGSGFTRQLPPVTTPDPRAPRIEVLAQTVVVSSPRILLYHTHTHESYEKPETGDCDYIETAQWRTADPRYSIVSVGDELVGRLAALGIGVTHDVTDFELDSLSYSYGRSLDMLEARSGPDSPFELYIDMHRDAYSATGSGNPFVAVIDGERVARLMVLIGTGEGSNGDGVFDIKPDYEKNLALARRITDELNSIAPGICRPVMIKGSRYNQHVSPNAILIEVGHNRNTLEEAKRAMPYLALALKQVLA